MKEPGERNRRGAGWRNRGIPALHLRPRHRADDLDRAGRQSVQAEDTDFGIEFDRATVVKVTGLLTEQGIAQADRCPEEDRSQREASCVG